MQFYPILNYPGYSITHCGIIQNPEGKVLKQYKRFTKDRKRRPRIRHLRVSLSKDNKPKWFTVHRLVALNFIPNPLNLPQVNHKDGDKFNNCDWNLEWANNSDNIIHAYKIGLIKTENKVLGARRGSEVVNAHPIKLVPKAGGTSMSFETVEAAKLFLKCNHSVSIHQALREQTRTVKGYYVREL